MFRFGDSDSVDMLIIFRKCAEAGEVCISEALYSAPGVAELLSGRKVTAFDAPLRGVEGEASVYRILPEAI